MLRAGSAAVELFNISHFQERPAPTAYITQETDVGNTQSSLSPSLRVLPSFFPPFCLRLTL